MGKDWRLDLPVLVIVTSLLVMEIGLVFRMVYCGEEWSGGGCEMVAVILQTSPIEDSETGHNQHTAARIPLNIDEGVLQSCAYVHLVDGSEGKFTSLLTPSPRSTTPTPRRPESRRIGRPPHGPSLGLCSQPTILGN